MRNLYTILLLIFSHISFAQITFSYDDAGNRVLRKTSGALPVTLISFTATKVSNDSQGSTALLTWQTSTETNSDRFDIYRSQDGKKWSNIGIVTSNGDEKSTSWYSFPDNNPMNGENLYRLKMIDRDGSFSFSRIQSVYFETQINFYPNPVKDLLKIKGIPNGVTADGTIQIINASGKTVLSLNSIPVNGIDISGLPIAIYIIKISLKDGTSTISKIVKE
jgi:sucrose-6-phosphate hydrolase SacC (GH32 family)